MYSIYQGLTKLLNALKESQNKETVDGIIKEAGEFQEVFKILEGGRHNLSQLEVRVTLIWLWFVLMNYGFKSVFWCLHVCVQAFVLKWT